MSSAIASLIAVLALWVCLAFFCCSGSAYKTSKVTYRVDGTGRAQASLTRTLQEEQNNERLRYHGPKPLTDRPASSFIFPLRMKKSTVVLSPPFLLMAGSLKTQHRAAVLQSQP